MNKTKQKIGQLVPSGGRGAPSGMQSRCVDRTLGIRVMYWFILELECTTKRVGGCTILFQKTFGRGRVTARTPRHMRTRIKWCDNKENSYGCSFGRAGLLESSQVNAGRGQDNTLQTKERVNGSAPTCCRYIEVHNTVWKWREYVSGRLSDSPAITQSNPEQHLVTCQSLMGVKATVSDQEPLQQPICNGVRTNVLCKMFGPR